jgi:hypothetical protein
MRSCACLFKRKRRARHARGEIAARAALPHFRLRQRSSRALLRCSAAPACHRQAGPSLDRTADAFLRASGEPHTRVHAAGGRHLQREAPHHRLARRA